MRAEYEFRGRLARIAGVAFALALALSPEAWGQTFSSTGTLNFARTGHQATLLPDGRVLVSGGMDNSGSSILQAEVYTPGTGAWSVEASNLTGRIEHAATLLQDGRVLVVGGVPQYSQCSSSQSAETLTPGAQSWVATGSLPAVVGSGMAVARLKDGRVLVSGGGNRCGAVYATSALFDPSTNTWSATSSMNVPREFHSLVLLADGRVLAAGGVTGSPFNMVASAEVFNPATGLWTPVGTAARERATACGQYMQTFLTTLQSGVVLAAGAWMGGCQSGAFPSTNADVYNPATGNWAPVGALNTGRASTTPTILPDGRVLLAGGMVGTPSSAPSASAEIFNPATGTWSLTGSLAAPRANHTATLLAGGTVLIAGGSDTLGAVATAELYSATSCELALTASDTAGTLNLGFTLKTSLPTTFGLWLGVSGSIVNLFSAPLPAIPAGLSFNVPIPGFPHLGNIWVLSALSTPAGGMLCVDNKVVATGP